jgi:hypothetical protein
MGGTHACPFQRPRRGIFSSGGAPFGKFDSSCFRSICYLIEPSANYRSRQTQSAQTRRADSTAEHFGRGLRSRVSPIWSFVASDGDFDGSTLGILKRGINRPAVTQKRKAAANRVNRVPVISAIRPQTIAPRVIAPWDRTIISAIPRSFQHRVIENTK